MPVVATRRERIQSGLRRSPCRVFRRRSPWLEQLLEFDVIRHAAMPYYDRIMNRRYTPPSERVCRIEILAEKPVNGCLPVSVDFDVKGVGR
jgi:hypothetical protein